MAYQKQMVTATDRNVGAPTSGMAITQTLYVSTVGTGVDGLSWVTAFNTINEALDAASTDAGDSTLILIAPSTTAYDINVTGDPTWAANVILQGTYRTWTRIVNTHASATSILKLTGKSGLISLNFDLEAGTHNGLVMSSPGFLVQGCFFTGTAVTGAATMLDLSAGAQVLNGRVMDCEFIGNATHVTAIKLTKIAYSIFMDLRIGDCLKGIHITDATSDANHLEDILLHSSTIGFDIDAGNSQHFVNILLHDCTTNFDDEVGDHMFHGIANQFPITTYPDNLTGTSIPTHASGSTWGVDTELRSAATATVPFAITGIVGIPSASEMYRVRLSSDSGSTHFLDVIIDSTKKASAALPSDTDYIFNIGTRISGSAQSVSGGNTIDVWLKVQEL
jgi:hypothetical protein